MDVKNDKVITLLGYFSKYELNRFRKFLLSPYFNENEDAVVFYDALEFFLRKEKPEFTRDSIWKKAFRKAPYSEQKYRRLASDLTKLAYRFLSVEWHERGGLSLYEGILKRVNAAPLNKHYKTALRNFRKELDDHSYRDSYYFYYKYISEYESHVHLERTNARRTTLSNLQDADTNLDTFYIINKLKHFCDALNYKTFLSIEIEVKLLPQLLQFVEENGYLDIPIVHIYYHISKTLTHPENSDHYYKIVELLEEHYMLFSPTELRTMYIYATNYCITQINLGNAEYYRILYELYFILLKRKTIFNKEGELDERHYKNIISLGVRLKDYDGIENFILEYSPKLPKIVKDNALTYNLAHVYYSKRDYEKVIEQLRYVEYNDVFYALGSRFMLLKTYYETSEFKAFEAQMDSFNIYLRRNKLISGDMKIQYMNCLKYIKKMYNTPKYNKDTFVGLKQKIEENPQVINKNWLYEKLDELIDSRR